MAARRTPGPVEASTLTFIKTLGALTARQKVLAATAVRDAQLLDGEDAGSAATALSRELRQVVAALEPVAIAQPRPAPSTVEARADAVQQRRDELEERRRRQQRR